MEVNQNESSTPSENTKTDLENHTPRDGFDNTGTQGYDSLQDAGYTGTKTNDQSNGETSGTGSSSEDFHEVPPKEDDPISDEDRALDAGI
jgi:hypothetical protein